MMTETKLGHCKKHDGASEFACGEKVKDTAERHGIGMECEIPSGIDRCAICMAWMSYDHTTVTTAQEVELLRGILIEEHRDGNDALAAVWVNEVQYHCDLKPSSIGGVMNSAQNKKLCWTNGETCALTSKGHAWLWQNRDVFELNQHERDILQRPFEK